MAYSIGEGQGGFIYRGSFYKGTGIRKQKAEVRETGFIPPRSASRAESRMIRMENGSAETMGNLVI